jgi:hypothetical protein
MAHPCHLWILPRVQVASIVATRLPGLRVCPIVTITTFPRVILLPVPPRLPVSAPPWPMLYQLPSGRHYPCHLRLHPRANWLPDQAVSVAYIHTDRKSSHLVSLSTRFRRLMAQMTANIRIQPPAQKLMVEMRRRHICGLRYHLHVNASTRSRILPLGPDDLQVSATRLVRTFLHS